MPPGFENKIMHASFRVGTTSIMASDGCSAEKQNFQGFSLSLSVPTETEARRVFTALAEGGQVRMPLTKTFWSPCFGMVEDRFGIGWMIRHLTGKPVKDFVIQTFCFPLPSVEQEQTKSYFHAFSLGGTGPHGSIWRSCLTSSSL